MSFIDKWVSYMQDSAVQVQYSIQLTLLATFSNFALKEESLEQYI